MRVGSPFLAWRLWRRGKWGIGGGRRGGGVSRGRRGRRGVGEGGGGEGEGTQFKILHYFSFHPKVPGFLTKIFESRKG